MQWGWQSTAVLLHLSCHLVRLSWQFTTHSLFRVLPNGTTRCQVLCDTKQHLFWLHTPPMSQETYSLLYLYIHLCDACLSFRCVCVCLSTSVSFVCLSVCECVCECVWVCLSMYVYVFCVMVCVWMWVWTCGFVSRLEKQSSFVEFFHKHFSPQFSIVSKIKI